MVEILKIRPFNLTTNKMTFINKNLFGYVEEKNYCKRYQEGLDTAYANFVSTLTILIQGYSIQRKCLVFFFFSLSLKTILEVM